MIFYLHDVNELITEHTKLKAYDLNIKEFGSSRKTLTKGDKIKLKGLLYEVVNYEYSGHHEKGIHLIQPYYENFYYAEEVEDNDSRLKLTTRGVGDIGKKMKYLVFSNSGLCYQEAEIIDFYYNKDLGKNV